MRAFCGGVGELLCSDCEARCALLTFFRALLDGSCYENFGPSKLPISSQPCTARSSKDKSDVGSREGGSRGSTSLAVYRLRQTLFDFGELLDGHAFFDGFEEIGQVLWELLTIRLVRAEELGDVDVDLHIRFERLG